MATERSICLEVLQDLYENAHLNVQGRAIFMEPFTVFTIAIVADNKIFAVNGEAECNSDDRFSYIDGAEIARKRAFRKLVDIPEARWAIINLIPDAMEYIV